MTENGLLIIQTIFNSIWNIVNGVTIPGTQITILDFAIAILLVRIIVLVARKILGVGDK